MKATEHIQKEKEKIFKEYLTLSKPKYFVEDLESFRNFKIFNTKTLR